MAEAPRDLNNWPAMLGFDGSTTRPVATDSNGYLQVEMVSDLETSSAAAVTAVADSASSVTLLAANTSRKTASITNDSSARLYIKMGTTASATDYTVSLAQHGHFVLPIRYTGRIDGIWSGDPNDGAARITEYT